MSRLTQGVYVPKRMDPLERYKLLCTEVQDRLHSEATLAGLSAAVMLDIPLIGEPPTKVYVANIAAGSYGKDIRVVPERESVLHEGRLISDPVGMVMDCARLCASPQALVVADGVLAQELCSHEALLIGAEGMRGRPGVGRMGFVVRHADPLAESPGETWMRLLAIQLGYEVISQFYVKSGEREAYLDLLIAGSRIALEFDGIFKYKKRGVAKVIQQQLRDSDLQAIGFQVLHLIWQQLANVEQLDKRLRYAGAVPVRPRESLDW
jgi:hypothetical protein